MKISQNANGHTRWRPENAVSVWRGWGLWIQSSRLFLNWEAEVREERFAEVREKRFEMKGFFYFVVFVL